MIGSDQAAAVHAAKLRNAASENSSAAVTGANSAEAHAPSTTGVSAGSATCDGETTELPPQPAATTKPAAAMEPVFAEKPMASVEKQAKAVDTCDESEPAAAEDVGDAELPAVQPSSDDAEPN
eukprot:2761968-Pleurochrysis_carterae.AAC.1